MVTGVGKGVRGGEVSDTRGHVIGGGPETCTTTKTNLTGKVGVRRMDHCRMVRVCGVGPPGDGVSHEGRQTRVPKGCESSGTLSSEVHTDSGVVRTVLEVFLPDTANSEEENRTVCHP